MNDLEQNIHWLRQVEEIVQSVAESQLSGEQLNKTQIIILYAINNLQENVTISKEVKKFGIGPAVCSKNVGILLRLKLIESCENSQDKRRMDLSLTAKGKRALRQAANQLSDLIKRAQITVKEIL